MKDLNSGRALYSIDLEMVIDQYADMVYRIAFVQMKQSYHAEDIVQEVFLRLVKYRDTIECEEHLKAWLIRVTLNCCKKYFDKASNKKEVAMEAERGYVEQGKMDHYKIEEEDSTIIIAVKKLPEKYRSVIHLFYYEEYSIKEISSILKQTESAVKTKLSRAREMLRKLLEEAHENERRI